MIDYENGEVIDLLPALMKYDSDIKAISYALRKGKEKMILYTEQTKLLANIDALPEEIIDLLSLEPNSHYYDQNFELEQKRKIIRSTLGWYMRAGTVEAVEEMMQVVFGSGGAVEWYDFTDAIGEPGQFDVYTDTILTQELIEQMLLILKRVKKASAHLRHLNIKREHNTKVEFGSTFVTCIKNAFYTSDEQENYFDVDFMFASTLNQKISNVMRGVE